MSGLFTTGIVSPGKLISSAYGADTKESGTPADTSTASDAEKPSYEARLSALEDLMKKKADKPDTTNGFKTSLNGRVYLDYYDLSGDSSATTPSFRDDLSFGGFKDLRLGAVGEGYGHYAFKMDFYFANSNTVEIRDVWFSADDVPGLSMFKIGHQRVEEGISSLLGGMHTNFISFEGCDFLTFYRLGLSSRHLWAEDRLRWHVGVYDYKPVAGQWRNEVSERLDWGVIANTRLTYMPYMSKSDDGKADGKQMMLWGVNYGFYDPNDATQTYTQRYSQISGFGALQRVSLGKVDHYNQVGAEFVMQDGPFALQSEAYARSYDLESGKKPTVWGVYVEGRYYLTGDYRRFNAKQAIWGAAKLNNNLDFERGECRNYVNHLGAWELALRWNFENLSGFTKSGLSGVAADKTNDFSVGLNWYWTERSRMMFDYTRIVPMENSGGHASLNLFATAFRYYF
ncbi:MAG: porin [Planctomycetia bacterium]|nr:porin [Planctomycetia bacterium]